VAEWTAAGRRGRTDAELLGAAPLAWGRCFRDVLDNPRLQ
jgi:hypothetical protein